MSRSTKAASNSKILAPLHADRLSARDWHDTCDVLVIGWGAAGLDAAGRTAKNTARAAAAATSPPRANAVSRPRGRRECEVCGSTGIRPSVASTGIKRPTSAANSQ